MNSEESSSPTPLEPPAEMTADQRAEARRYGEISLACTLTDMALDLTYLAAMAFFLGRPLDTWLAGFEVLAGEHSLLRLSALFGLVIGIHILVSLPLSFYAGYVVEHQFGLSHQSVLRWVRNWGLRNLLAIVLGWAMYAAVFWMMWTLGVYWWWVAAGVFFLVSILIGQIAPVIITPLFYKVEKLDRPDLAERIRRLVEGTGLRIEGVYRLGLSVDTAKANAMLAGFGATRRVLMGDTLLDRFSPEEIEVVFAHEVGHHVHRHLPKLVAIGAVISTAGFWLCDRAIVRWAGVDDASAVPTYCLPMVMFVFAVFMLSVEPFLNAISRHFERQCDRYALAKTQAPATYRSAFQKLAQLNKADPDPHPLEVFFLHSHPPIAERLAMADEVVGS